MIKPFERGSDPSYLSLLGSLSMRSYISWREEEIFPYKVWKPSLAYAF